MATETVENVTNESTYELSVESASQWTDYIDLGLKALLVIAAFAIYARL